MLVVATGEPQYSIRQPADARAAFPQGATCRKSLDNLVNLTNFFIVMQVTIHQAKTQLSKLIAAVERGEEVIIARRDKRVARIVAVKAEKPVRVLGFLASRKVKLDGFFDPALELRIAGDFYHDEVADSAKPAT